VSTHELELQLRALGAEIDFPAEPDLRGAIRARVARRRGGRRRWLVVAVAALAIAVAGVLAVPSARTAIKDWLGFGAVRFRFVDELPPRAVSSEPDLGVRMALQDAQDRASFRIVSPPDELGKPTVYLRDPPRGGLVSFLYGTPEQARLIVSELRGDFHPFLEKTLSQSTVAESVEIDGREGWWLEGAHFVEYADAAGRFGASPPRLAGHVLLWMRGPVTYRLEGPLTKKQAIEIADSIS
jgi:hypothetical protein